MSVAALLFLGGFHKTKNKEPKRKSYNRFKGDLWFDLDEKYLDLQLSKQSIKNKQ